MLPLNRHSTLPELRSLVELFQPDEIFPNTIYDQKGFLDYYMMPSLFKGVVAETGLKKCKDEAERMAQEYKGRSRDQPTSMRTTNLQFPSTSLGVKLSAANFDVAEPCLLRGEEVRGESEEDSIKGPLAFVDNLSILCQGLEFAAPNAGDLDDDQDEETPAESQAMPQPNAIRPIYASQKSPRISRTVSFAEPAPPIRSSQNSTTSIRRQQTIRIIPDCPVSTTPKQMPKGSDAHHSLCKCNRDSWPKQQRRSHSRLRAAARQVRSLANVLASNANHIATQLVLEQEKFLALQHSDAGRLLTSPATSTWSSVAASRQMNDANVEANMAALSSGHAISFNHSTP